MRILQVSSELFPLLKTGGLADVAGALPAALGAQACDVRPLLPGFPAVVAGLHAAQTIGNFTTPWGERIEVVLGHLPGLGAAGQALMPMPITTGVLLHWDGALRTWPTD